MQIHLLTYYRNLVEGINGMTKEIEVYFDEGTDCYDKSPTKESKNKVIFGGNFRFI